MHNPSIRRHRLQISRKIRSADEIHNDIYALSVCSSKDLLRPILGSVVKASGGAESGSAEIDFGLGAAGDKNLRGVSEARELDAGDGDGGGTGVPEDGLGGLELADEVEGLGCCYPGLVQSC